MKINQKYITDHWEYVVLGACVAVALLILFASLISGVEEVDDSPSGAGKLERKPIISKNACKFLDKDADKSHELKNNPFELPLKPVVVVKPQPPQPKPQPRPQPQQPKPQSRPQPQQPKPQPQPQQPAPVAPQVVETKQKEPVQGTVAYTFRIEKNDGSKVACINVVIGEKEQPIMMRAGDSRLGISVREITDDWIEIQDAKAKKLVRVSMRESKKVWLLEE